VKEAMWGGHAGMRPPSPCASTSGDSTASAASTRSGASTAASRRRTGASLRDSEKAATALVGRLPSLYIGPWQEFALGRALQQRPDRRARPAGADSAADSSDAAEDLAFFKAFASQSDEEGIRNLLRCAPRFVPVMQSLGRGSQAHAAHTAIAADPPAATSPQQRPASGAVPSRATAAAATTAAARRPKPAAAASVPAQRRRRMQQLQVMYRTAGEGDEGGGSSGGGGSDGDGASGTASGASASESPPLPPLLPPLLLPPPSPSQRALLPPCSPLQAGSRATAPALSPSAPRSPASPTPLSAEWEDEVDELLEWTMGLADFE